MSNYATAKAALNALIRVYRRENPEISFLSFGTCTVKTDLNDASVQAGPDLPELYGLLQKASQPGYLASPDERAGHIAQILDSASSTSGPEIETGTAP